MKKLTEIIGTKYPVIAGAMAQISNHRLVAAASNAGALGVIASGGLTSEQVAYEIKECKRLTGKPFAVNLMLMQPNIQEIIDCVIAENVKIVTTGAGTPKPYMARLKAAGIIVIPVIPSVDIAVKMSELGVDAVIAEGTEAGGHIGETTTLTLVPQVVDAVSIPVIAAGGIADARGVLAVEALGASGIQMGTVFLASEEAPIPQSYKEKIIEAKDNDTMVTGRSGGAPVRGIRNQLLEDFLALERKFASRNELEKLTMGSLRKSVKEGDMENGSIMAGQIAGLVKEIKPVRQIIETIVTDSQQLKTDLVVRDFF